MTIPTSFEMLKGMHIKDAFLLIAMLYLGYLLCICFYNIYLHPLRHIPGSKLAVMGPYLEFYHEVIRQGQYLWEIEKMHDKYGPIVRVNEREIHIRDSSYYHTIYAAGSRKTNKDAATVGAFDVPNSTAATVDHDQHRARRGYLNPYFSKRSLANLEPTIHERISKLLNRLEQHQNNDDIITLDGIFSALTADVICSRFYGKHFDYLSIPDYHFVVRDGFQGLTKLYHLGRFLPTLVTILKCLPQQIIRLILPNLADLIVMRDEIQANGIAQFTSSQTADSKASALVGALGDKNIPPHERTVARLLDEGTVFLFAGTETTSRTLAVTMFYLLTNPDCLKKLRAELDTLPSTEDYQHSLSTLESLPYLSGVVHEGLRLAFGPITRSARVPMNVDLQYKEYTIPAGTPLSMSTYFVHTDKELYPEPEKFKPERWIQAAEENIPLKKFLTNFSQGSRQCIGISMSFAEMYLTISRVARAYNFELYETTAADLDMTYARIVPYPKEIPGKTEGLGEIRVKIVGKNHSQIEE
ncbi:Sat11 [Stachybotrys chartarum IBT 7711]|uniref:Cytochrome P450 monooxygenase SAT11 n=1 Tax=Stachybotrys chartarum (strain CBS 109288 / IBT 7711) TaxID=1280523 RepID=SAT11_STACB|nr:RecName: Full=Cytochrome P450 monooxygenase SAT11; AltName: Full=Satratoxin biosynthesis SC2 cluster protein 11 [Stachybotrys chartarum IBT 7711]KEY67210.1 Sat11 [Stachybotrys chartarum IBT 7711]KFA53043.1 Sat11 [Stachybotrys chartarum IBT 40293]